MLAASSEPVYAARVILCGIDEAGRGPLAGPVTAAAVILPSDFPREGLADSKALAPELRLETNDRIRAGRVSWGLGWAWPEEIDRLNILHASLLAMRRAYYAMLGQQIPDEPRPGNSGHPYAPAVARGGPIPNSPPDSAVVDGRHAPMLPIPCEAIVKGDATVPEIQAASILAKVARDKWMIEYSAVEPVYLFEKHKGYPTPQHRRLLQEHGPSRIHRYTFRST